MVCIVSFVCLYNYEFWFSLYKIVRSSVILLLPLFIITGNDLHFFNLILYWFNLTEHGLYCFTSPNGSCCIISCFTVSSLLGMAFIVSLPSSPVHHYWACFVLFHFILPLFIITWHGLHCFTSCFIGCSLLGLVGIVSLHASFVLPYWALLVLFHYILNWFFLNGRNLYCFTSCFTCSSLLDMTGIVSLHA